MIRNSAIIFIFTRQYFQKTSYIPGIISKNSYLIERGGVGDEAITGNPSVSGFKANNAAKVSRLPDGASCIASEANHAHSRLHRNGRSSGRATGHFSFIQS